MEGTHLYRKEDLVCYSHLRWGFVYQRPRHLMSRFARHRRVYFIEEPLLQECATPALDIRVCPQSNVKVVTPVLPGSMDVAAARGEIARLVRDLFRSQKVREHVAWYYTPAALDFRPDIRPRAAIYDCMDELSL